ncbi:hypothetical protein [Streptomyces sp. JNUCC 63]
MGRSLLVVIWHLINDPDARFQDLDSDFHTRHVDLARRKRSHVHRPEALTFPQR